MSVGGFDLLGLRIKLAHRHTLITHFGPVDKAKGVRSLVSAFDDHQEQRENSLQGPEKNNASLYGPRKRNFLI